MESVLKAPFWALPKKTVNAVDTTTKPPARRRAPVFIHDAVIPWQGDTLLLAELRRDADDQDE